MLVGVASTPRALSMSPVTNDHFCAEQLLGEFLSHSQHLPPRAALRLQGPAWPGPREHSKCMGPSSLGPKHSSCFVSTARTVFRAPSFHNTCLLLQSLHGPTPLRPFLCFLGYLLISQSPSPKLHLRACFWRIQPKTILIFLNCF